MEVLSKIVLDALALIALVLAAYGMVCVLKRFDESPRRCSRILGFVLWMALDFVLFLTAGVVCIANIGPRSYQLFFWAGVFLVLGFAVWFKLDAIEKESLVGN